LRRFVSNPLGRGRVEGAECKGRRKPRRNRVKRDLYAPLMISKEKKNTNKKKPHSGRGRGGGRTLRHTTKGRDREKENNSAQKTSSWVPR